jgi:hypothetical protein
MKYSLFFLLNLAVCGMLFWIGLNKFFGFEEMFNRAFDHHYSRTGAYYYFRLYEPNYIAMWALPLPLTALWAPAALKDGNPWFFVPFAVAAAPILIYCALAFLSCLMVVGTFAGLFASMSSVLGIVFLVEAAIFFFAAYSVTAP